MYTATLSKSAFEKLKKFEPGKNIPNTECELFIKGSLRSKNKERILLKKYYVREGEYFGRKLKNLNTLIYYKNILGEIRELVLPDKLAIIDGEIVGYTMPFIEKSKNLQTILNSDISLEDKLVYLRQIGTILEEIKNIKDFPYDFHIGDLHEGNFLIDETNSLKVVDLDSAYIGQDEPSHTAYYLLKNSYLESFPSKYKKSSSGLIIPSNETDLYCYNMILLDFLSGEAMYKKDLDIFYKYLSHLKDIGIDSELIRIFQSIYFSNFNQNPFSLLKTISVNLRKDMSYQTFKKKYKLK